MLLQRVRSARVTVDGDPVGAIGHGLLALVGVEQGDTPSDAERMAEKTVALRIFSDAAGRFNHSLAEVGGAALVVSQFTLMADTRRGRRPSFTGAAPPELAERLVDTFAAAVGRLGVPVVTGRFRAHMVVALENDGPVTLLLDSHE